MTYEVTIGGRAASVEVKRHPVSGYLVRIDDGPVAHVEAGALGAAEWFLADEASRRTLSMHLSGDDVAMQVAGHGIAGTVVDPRKNALTQAKAGAEGVIRTPMPGAVSRVLVAAGATVTVGQVLVVIEAMKMENEFKSPIAGTVVEVPVTAGTTVESNTVLVVVKGGEA